MVAGIIQPSVSPFASHVILVRKGDNGWRFYVNYQALNQVTVSNKFPMPTIDELLDKLVRAIIFSKLDIKSGYHQIQVKEKDMEKNCFSDTQRTLSDTFQTKQCVTMF